MNTKSRKFVKRRNVIKFGLFLIFIVFLFSLLEVNCRIIDPKRHDEYARAGLDQAVRDLCREQSQSIPGIMKSRKIPGLSVALVDREGMLWGAGFGFTDFDHKTPITRDTSFLIGSVSKTFAALAIMCGVRDGLVDLDTPITTYLPEFTIKSHFEANAQDKITLRHLLNHTSGMANEAPIGNGCQPSYGSLAERANSICSTWLRFPVGARWDYSSAGYDLVSYILEVQAQQPFADYLEEKVLRPLNMPNTTVDKMKIEANRTRAIGHSSRHYKRLPLASDIPWVGAGGVYASANDLARLIQFFLNWGTVDGQRLLDEESIMAMYTPSTHQNYGLGIQIWKRTVGHGGDGLGFSADMLWSPEYGFGGVILINAREIDNINDQHLDWFKGLLRSMLDKGLVQKIEGSPKRPAIIDPYRFDFNRYQPPDPNTFTPYQDSWKKYLGNYKYIWQGWELRNYAKIVVAFGYYPNPIEVQQIDGYLCVAESPLDEYRPGLFFTSAGDCLDFTGPVVTWNYIRLKK